MTQTVLEKAARAMEPHVWRDIDRLTASRRDPQWVELNSRVRAQRPAHLVALAFGAGVLANTATRALAQ